MPESLERLFKSFARDLRAADKAPRTIAIYHQGVRFFADWLAEQNMPATTEQLTKDNISEWLVSLRDRGQADTTILTRYRSLRRFTRWAHAEGLLSAEPMATLEQPKPKPRPVEIVDDDTIGKLLKVCRGRRFQDVRNTAIVRTLMDTGVRAAELAGMTMEDVDLDGEEIHVVGKGRRPRDIPIGTKTVRALDKYERERAGHRHAHLDAYWLSQRGGYSTDGLDDLLKALCRQAGVPPLHLHQFRHAKAHDHLLAGGKERTLKKLMGWRSDAMLEVYGESLAVERAHAEARRLRRGDRL